MNDGRVVAAVTVVVDTVLRVPALPEAGDDVIASSSRTLPGGGATTMAAAARAGAEVVHAGVLGDGPLARLAADALAAEGIRMPLPAVRGIDQGHVVVLVDGRAERTFVSVPGAEGRVTRQALARIDVTDEDVVVVSGYALAHERLGAALPAWLDRLPSTARVVLDPSPLADRLAPERLAAVLARADVVTANAREARLLGPALAAASSRGASVVRRRGAEGCTVAVGREDPVVVRAPAVRAVDTTGAGDVHTGVLAASLARGLGILDAARRAGEAAAHAVTVEGAGPEAAPRLAAPHPPVSHQDAGRPAARRDVRR